MPANQGHPASSQQFSHASARSLHPGKSPREGTCEETHLPKVERTTSPFWTKTKCWAPSSPSGTAVASCLYLSTATSPHPPPAHLNSPTAGPGPPPAPPVLLLKAPEGSRDSFPPVRSNKQNKHPIPRPSLSSLFFFLLQAPTLTVVFLEEKKRRRRRRRRGRRRRGGRGGGRGRGRR